MANLIKGKDVKPRNDRSLGKDLLKIVGIGLAAGVGLVAGTNAVMKKVTKKDEEETFEED